MTISKYKNIQIWKYTNIQKYECEKSKRVLKESKESKKVTKVNKVRK